MKKLDKLEMIFKKLHIKKENRDPKWKKYANKLGIKKYGNRFKIQFKGCYKMEINSKAFAIPILTAIIEIANALEFVSIL